MSWMHTGTVAAVAVFSLAASPHLPTLDLQHMVNARINSGTGGSGVGQDPSLAPGTHRPVLPAVVERLVRDEAAQAQVVSGRVVEIRSKVVYLELEGSGAVIPLESQHLYFRERVKDGQEVKVAFATDGTQNLGVALWAGPGESPQRTLAEIPATAR